MTDKELAEEYVDTLLNKDDPEFDKFLDENLGDLKLTKKQAGILLGIIKGSGISSFLAGLKAGKDMNVATKVFRTKMSQTSVISHHPETIFGIEMVFFSLFCTNIQQKFVTLPQNYDRWQNFLNVVPRFGTTIY